MNLWFISPEILEMLEFEKDKNGHYRVRSHHLNKSRLANPEEIIRQLVFAQLMTHYHYPYENLVIEPLIKMGISKKRADIGIINQQGNFETIIEVKQISNDESVQQLHSYMHASGVKYGALITLFERQVYYRDSTGQITTISDLPTYLNKQLTEFTLINNRKTEDFQPVNQLNDLGIFIKSRLSAKRSEIEIKGQKIIISNTDLLDFSKLRRKAIEAGIVLPSSINKSNWDLMLQHLFENAPPVNIESNENKTNEAERSFRNYIETKCVKTDEKINVLFRDIYNNFTSWYINEYSENRSFLPSKINISTQLKKSGFEVRKIGGQIYVNGLQFNG